VDGLYLKVLSAWELIMLRIGEFSKMAKVTVKTLRYYDRLNILKPEIIDKKNKYRYYSHKQLKIITQILSMKKMGFSLEEISIIIDNEISNEEFTKMLTKKQKEIKKSISFERSKLTNIKNFIKTLKETDMTKVTVKELPEVIVASMRLKKANYSELFKVVPPMGKKMEKHGAICKLPEYCFNIYHDDEYKETDIDVEICESVVDFCNNEDGIVYKKIKKVEKAACIFHKGDYESLGKSYSNLMTWIKENGYIMNGHSRESYIDGIWNKENSKDWLTEIQIPIKK